MFQSDSDGVVSMPCIRNSRNLRPCRDVNRLPNRLCQPREGGSRRTQSLLEAEGKGMLFRPRQQCSLIYPFCHQVPPTARPAPQASTPTLRVRVPLGSFRHAWVGSSRHAWVRHRHSEKDAAVMRHDVRALKYTCLVASACSVRACQRAVQRH
jgi:hypothetical protein